MPTIKNSNLNNTFKQYVASVTCLGKMATGECIYHFKAIYSLVYLFITRCNTFTPQIQRIHKPCIPLHRDISKCTPCTVKCIPGKWLHFKRPSHYYQSKDCLDVVHCTLFLLYRSGLNLIVGVSLMPNYNLWFTNNKQSYSILAIVKAQKKLPKCKF